MIVEDLWRTWGLYLNYPKCCVDAFCEEDTSNRGVNEEEDPFYLSGFIPCKCCHAKTKHLSIKEANKLLGTSIDNSPISSVLVDFKNTLNTASGDRFKYLAEKVGLDYKEYLTFLAEEIIRMEKYQNEN